MVAESIESVSEAEREPGTASGLMGHSKGNTIGCPCEGDHFPSPTEIQEACARIRGKNIQEAGPSNLYQYSCGSFALVERDIRAVVPNAAEGILACLRGSGVLQAFRVRQELINYKKVSLHVHQQGLQLERSLRQVTTFFRETMVTPGGFPVHTERRTELSDALMQCKGRCQASWDARHIGKHICCVPRHPANECEDILKQLPRSLHCWRLGIDSKNVMVTGKVLKSDWAPHGSQTPSQTQVAAHEKTSDSVGFLGSTMAIISSMHWPGHVKEFVNLVLVVRGVNKALRIRDELKRAIDAFEDSLHQIEAVLAELQRLPTPAETVRRLEAEGQKVDKDTDWLLGGITLYRKHRNLLSGCMPLLKEVVHWLKKIDSVGESDPGRLFVAGDSGGSGGAAALPPAMFVPAGFIANTMLDEVFLGVLRKYLPEMRCVLVTSGWPDWLTSLTPQEDIGIGKSHSRNACKVCNKISGLFVHRGICCECEEVARGEGRCPFNDKCSTSWFCLHDRRCFVCDCHSCDQCRIWRGDGDVVLHLVAQFRPARIFLDFDRTLASTRSGGAPCVGKHNVDHELLSLFWNHPGACAIVTRNPHVAEIQAFLTSHGVPDDMTVHSLKRPKSKAEFILPGLAEGDTAIFVDDTVEELVDPMLVGDSRVYRVLFVRGML